MPEEVEETSKELHLQPQSYKKMSKFPIFAVLKLEGNYKTPMACTAKQTTMKMGQC